MEEPSVIGKPSHQTAAPLQEEEQDEELATQPISTDLTFQSENNDNIQKKENDEQEESASNTSSTATGTAKSNNNNDDDDDETQTTEVASSQPSLSKILNVARPEWPALFVAVFAMVASEGIGLVVPIVLANAYDVLIDESLSDEDRMADIHRFMGLVMILHFSGIIGGFIRHAILGIIGERLVARLRNQLYTSILRQEIAFFDEHKSGELVSRLGSDTTLLQNATSQSMPEFFLGIIKVIVSVVLMFWISYKLAGVTVGSVVVIFLIAVPFGIRIGQLSKSYQDELGAAQTRSTESLGAMRTVQSFAAEERERIRYESKIGNPDESTFFWYPTSTTTSAGHDDIDGENNDSTANKTTYSVGFFKAIWNSAFFSFVFGFGFFIMYAILWYGFILVNDGEISLGDLTAFQSYVFQIGFGLAATSGHLSKVVEALGASGRIFYLMDRIPNIPTPPPSDSQSTPENDKTMKAKAEGQNIKPQKASPAAAQPTHLKPDTMEGAVTLRDVSFSYPSRYNVPVLKNFNLTVPPNTTAALVGSSGSGKSTVVALLQRFYDVDSGVIEIDGRDIRSLDLSWLRRHIGYVQQEPQLFGLSVRENICYGVSSDGREITQEEIELVCQKANAHEFIMKWPNGYDTLVGERGVKLSGGQKQRIAIARALLVNPRILLLDEATSSLDAEAEHLVQEAIEKAVVGRTVLIVAHRLSTIQRASQIVVLDTHKIVDIGSHEELLGRCSKYQDLIKRQSLMHHHGGSDDDCNLPTIDAEYTNEGVESELQA